MSVTGPRQPVPLADALSEQHPVLRHLAVILDGNRRWARVHGHSALDGYRRGAERVLELLAWCEKVPGLDTVTVWPLSTENLHRPGPELRGLLDVIVETTQAIADTRRWRIRYLGAPGRLPPPVTSALDQAAGQTRHVTTLTVNIAVAYSGRDEITRSVRNLILAHEAEGTLGTLARGVTAEAIGEYLDTAGQPEPDLAIRTAGEQRLSGFLPWQTAYTELYFTSTPWPDFQHTDLLHALDWYRDRVRTYGR